MGTWGPALYSDDLAADLRGDLRDLLAQGLSTEVAVDKLAAEYASSLHDPDEGRVFWLAVAHAAWRLGRPSERATTEALRAIDSDADLRRWTNANQREQRRVVLERIALDLRSQAPAPKRLARHRIAENEWSVGELVGYQLVSGTWTLFRVIGHHVDKGGRHAICEPLDWLGPELPDAGKMIKLPVRRPVAPWEISQFMLGEPRRKKDSTRFVRTGVTSAPTQDPGRCAIFVFPYIDSQLRDLFGIG